MIVELVEQGHLNHLNYLNHHIPISTNSTFLLMFTNHFKVALRSLLRDQFYTLLNGIGLAIGMAAALLIFLWVSDELSFDNFHKKGGRIYRITASWTFGGKEEAIATTPSPLADAVREKVPEVEKYVRLMDLWGTVLKYDGRRFGAENGYLADAEFFEIFDFPFLHGSPENALSKPNNVVLTASKAKQIFGTTDVVGQPLQLAGKMELTVSAVLQDVPSNSHLQFDLLIPFRENIKKFEGDGALRWGALNYDAYALLRPGVDYQALGEKLSALPPVKEGQSNRFSFALQPLPEVYLDSGWLEYSSVPRGNPGNIRLVGIIGLLILLIACVNYVNLTTARSAHRARATGVRKVVGASRGQLFSQYLMEAAMLVGLASVLAIAIANMSLGMFEQLSGKHFADGQLFTQQTLLIVLGTALTAVLVSGIQPALQLSSFKPLEALRGSGFSGTAGKGGLRKVLVTSQFACSGVLIIGTLIMLAQMDFVKKQKLGYDRKQVFTFTCTDSKPMQLKTELLGQPGILEVAASGQSIVDISNRNSGFDYEGKDPNADPYLWTINVDGDFPGFFGLELKEGRWFRPGTIDSASFIINERAVEALGLTDGAVGKWMDFNGVKGTIVGVAKDFHFRSYHHKIEQLIFVQNPKWMWRVNVKTTGGKAAEAIAAAEKIFRKHEPNAIFEYEFLDEAYDQLYKTENRTSNLFLLFAGLAVFISCLGVFGLAAYTAERRTKEIGIRKVLGASVANLVSLLSKDFLKLVALALVIASPIAWYFMENWLENFAFHIEIGWQVFAVAGIIAVGIALLTVSFQSIKVAVANPAESLRSE
ncbi:MAG TPA: FtsX-like permease family protein [Bacteroidetes bacterium]|nr:FtsX-like permease family protein [Bacteroidota bacterium]